VIRWEAPLRWPSGAPQTAKPVSSRFAEHSLYDSSSELEAELRRFNVTDAVISADVALKRNGMPYANPPKGCELGAAVYFTRGGDQQVLAIDRYDYLPDNVWALARTIAALRQIERDGGPEILSQALGAFKALPGPGSEIERSGTWWAEVLGLQPYNCFVEDIEAAFREKAKTAHPDHGGSVEEFQRLVDAKFAALEGKR
jgi:hypothetical protein